MQVNSPTTDKSASNIISLPLAFVRSGYVYLGDGKAYGVGRNLYGWSRTTLSDLYAYYLAVEPTGTYPSNGFNRLDGFPLR